MKTIKTHKILIALVLMLTLVMSCKEQPKADVVEEEMVMKLPNKSDIHFDKALTALSKKEYKIGGEHLATGVNELKEEAKNKGSQFKINLDTSIKHLANIAEQLKKGEKADVDALRTMIANAEINVAHDYLVTDDVYVLTEPEKAKDYKLHKFLDHNLKNLETGTSKLEGEAKKAGEKLRAEGKELKQDYEAWKKRAEEHRKETEAFFATHKIHINL
jgi:FtsZ-binding cell division protein ZapB